jgi:hypothetical protein
MITIDKLQALPDKAIVERLDSSTKNGNKIYGLDNSTYPLLSDNWLNKVVVTNQAGLHAVLDTINYDLLQDATNNNFTAMIPNTYTLNIVHTNAVTNDIIVSVCACFTTF